MMKKLLLLCLPFAATLAMAQKGDDAAAKYAALITQQGLKEKLTILAGPEMEGRETASPGQKKAAAFIEDHFKKIGLKPGNGDSYQQLYPVYEDVLSEKKFRVNGKSYEWDKDFMFNIQTISTGNWNYNSVVFAGYGNVDSITHVNDYEGLDVKDKLVLVLDGGITTSPAAGRNFGGPSVAKINAARKNGAAGILIISADFPRKNPTSIKGRVYLTKPTTTAPTSSFVVATVSEEVAAALLGRTTKVSQSELKNIPKGNYVSEIAINAIKKTETLESSNVIGVLPGTDKKEEYVFLTGHYDHLGKQGNTIFYGADDDGSGTVGVMQMAEAFAAAAKKGSKPRRTMIFMTVSGEEKGLLGL